MAASSLSSSGVEMRDAFSAALVELGRERQDIVVLDADLHTSAKTSAFMAAFPDRFVQVGIAEQDLFGIPAGLALEGYIPFPSTFAAFASRRALEAHLHHPVQWFSYPAGRNSPHVRALVAKAGYVLAVTTNRGALQAADAPFQLSRYEILDTTGVSGLANLLTAR